MRTTLTIRGLCLLSCAGLLGACGGSSPSAGTASRGYSQALAFSRCRRSHGVPNFPDPSPSGGIQITAGMHISPFPPGVRTARQACRRLLPGGLALGKASAQDKAKLVALARCMRARPHDLPGPG